MSKLLHIQGAPKQSFYLIGLLCERMEAEGRGGACQSLVRPQIIYVSDILLVSAFFDVYCHSFFIRAHESGSVWHNVL